MPSISHNHHQITELRLLIEQFIQERRDKKLEDVGTDQVEKRQKILLQYERTTWLEDAAKRVGQIQLVTHAIKFTHPSAKGSSFYLQSANKVFKEVLVGTHNITHQRTDDVVGNAAALDVYKFLKLKYQGLSLLDYVLVNDPVLLKAFSDDIEQAQKWCIEFAGITTGRGEVASHRLAKQIYFPVDNADTYHLLAPLFPTTLVQTLHKRLQEDRFGENTKAAREARKNEKEFTVAYCEYPQSAIQNLNGYSEYPKLAVQKFGGTKPQNISQLNSERRGESWLLASCPPTWRSQSIIRPPLKVKTIFSAWFARRESVRKKIKKLGTFLKKTSHNNVGIRDARADMVAQIIDELLQTAAEIRDLDAGWSTEKECRLAMCEIYWLDPNRKQNDEEFAKEYFKMDWLDQIYSKFAEWFNFELQRYKLPMGDDENREWQITLEKEMNILKRELVYDK